MDDLILKQAKAYQAHEIHQLIKTVLDTYQLHHLRPAGVDDDIDHLETEYFNNNGDFWVLENKNGNIVGSCGLFKISNFTCELRKMYLDLQYQGKGYGKKMLVHVIDAAREKGYSNITLKTNSNLTEAIGLYQKLGFTEYKIFNHEKQDCDVAMVLNLEQYHKKTLF